MGFQTIISFFIYAIINAFTPGPGNILVLNTMSNYGWNKGKRLLAGVLAGYYCVQLACAIFVLGLEHIMQSVMIPMRYIGAGYVIWLSIHIAKSTPNNAPTQKDTSFFTGFVLQFVNVKIYLFGITALVNYVIPYNTSFVINLFFALVVATIGSIASITWGIMGNKFQSIYKAHYRLINIIMALLLIECAVSMLLN